MSGCGVPQPLDQPSSRTPSALVDTAAQASDSTVPLQRKVRIVRTRIVVDQDKCLGAGLCTVAPDYFELGDDGKVGLLHDGDVPETDMASVSDAVTMCPAEAIRLQKNPAT